MVKLSETDLREMLRRQADDFAMGSNPSRAIFRRAARRRTRNVLLASGAVLAIVAFTGISSTLLLDSDRSLESAPGESAVGAGGSPSIPSAHLRLVDYSLREPAPAADHETGPRFTLDDVRSHAACMRSQGFDVPAPTSQPGGGWAVILSNAEARDLGFGSREFREAWFVTCGLLGGPLSGDMIIAGPWPKVDRFMSCMSQEGFDLPEPVKDTSGRYDTDEWRFDLTGTSIDTSLPAWNRAMFVTCAPEDV